MTGLFSKIFHNLAIRVAMIGFSATIFTQCSSTKSPTPSATYNPLLTPPHGMNKSEYPFDDSGNYRRDWVKSGSTGRTSSSTLSPDPVINGYGARTSVSVPAARPPSVPQTVYAPPRTINPPTKTSPGVTTYHTVKSGDTLYSISRKYGTSVTELKRTNGLSGDLIRLGQSLRIR